MDAAGIAALITAGNAPPTGSADIGFHTGQVVSWDESSGTNVVTVQGVALSNLKALQGGIGILYQAGDVVGIIRFQTTYFVLGKVAAPGAGAANQIRYGFTNTIVNGFNTAPYVDLPGSPGPTLTNVYIGSSRRCLVLLTCLMDTSFSYGFMSFAVSGASTVAATSDRGLELGSQAGTGTQGVTAQVAANVVLTAADGLNSGFHTFTCKYGVVNVAGGAGINVLRRSITVIPF